MMDVSNQPLAGRQTEYPWLNSRLFLFLMTVMVFLVQILQNGYICFRSDHLTQIPLLYIQQDPSLYRNDWFLMNYAHFDVRFFHLLLLKLFAGVLGMGGGILVLYFILIFMTLVAWQGISNRLYRSPLPGLIVGLMGVFLYGQELGTNHLLEKIMIPRTEAYVFAYWGLYLLLAGHSFFAGVLLALGGYFQPAVGILFAIPMLVWLFARGGWGAKKDALLFVLGFVAAFAIPALFMGHGFMKTSTVSDQEEIRLAAYIRHPHHMVPHLWPWRIWLDFVGLGALFGFLWRRMRRENPEGWAFGLMALVIIGLLALFTVFIELIPAKKIILLQPFRMAVLLYFVMFMVIAPHIMGLIRRGDLLSVGRAAMLILAPLDWRFLAIAVPVELVLTRLEEQGRAVAWWVPVGPWLLGFGLLQFPYEKLDPTMSIDIPDSAQHIPVIFLAVLGLALMVRKMRLAERPRILPGAALGCVAVGALWISSFFWFPYQKMADEAGHRYQKKAGHLCWSFEFNPFPIKPLERAGAWAEKNTPKEALFIIPPGRELYGFRLWAKRAVLFNLKFFPYNPHGLKEWKERYLAVRGVLGDKSAGEKMEISEALTDIGASFLNKAYENLSAEKIRRIAERYKANYIITRTKYQVPFLVERHAETDHTKTMGHGKPYRVYEIVWAKR